MLFKKQKFDWPMVALLALGLFLYASYQPRFRLRPAMPADFIDEPLARSSQKPRSGSEESPARTGAVWPIPFSGNTATDILCPQIRLLTSPPSWSGIDCRGRRHPHCVTGTKRNTSGICQPHGRKTTSGISIGRQTGFKTVAKPCTICSNAWANSVPWPDFATHHDPDRQEPSLQRKL